MEIPYLCTSLHRLSSRANILFQVGDFAGEYYSVLLVCVVLFRSLVLNKRQLSRTGEITILAFAFTCFVVGGIAGVLMGGDFCQYDPTSKENAISRRPYVIFLGLGLGFSLLLSVIFVAVILIFRTSRKSMDIPERLRVTQSGAMAVGTTVRQDACLRTRDWSWWVSIQQTVISRQFS
ncbi:hypothetical protein M427DRAFT_135040 [Gonapodya prolifera JEL478]|uniref:Uncharacterized protein n=1 Tax=Gonapodya prolifera (strain JEL478) TaxID=1344416 RepID=A0A139AGK2_GONPJ|nr:hypothetical protein M427DRAFT_135040 [Gonapodya prolifera JEL478]|eukprot:KXS15575.1 hypothetical protein M427DRAFT_135040 [Gonapodya prolifera JEL478]